MPGEWQQENLQLDESDSVLHVLLVEDNPSDVLLVREAIRRSSVEADVMIAYDGEQALELLEQREFKPDFILLDLNLPKFNGFEILERYHRPGRVPVLVLTGSTYGEDQIRARDLGASDYVVKPADFREFLTVVRDLIERWGRAAA
jgi:chemotaxis family two-component system response regulator Rcp1